MPKLNRIITIKFIATNDLLKKFCLEDAKFEVVKKKKLLNLKILLVMEDMKRN